MPGSFGPQVPGRLHAAVWEQLPEAVLQAGYLFGEQRVQVSLGVPIDCSGVDEAFNRVDSSCRSAKDSARVRTKNLRVTSADCSHDLLGGDRGARGPGA